MASNRSMPRIGPADIRVSDIAQMRASLERKDFPIVKVMSTTHGVALYARLALETYPDIRVSLEQFEDTTSYKITIDKK